MEIWEQMRMFKKTSSLYESTLETRLEKGDWNLNFYECRDQQSQCRYFTWMKFYTLYSGKLDEDYDFLEDAHDYIQWLFPNYFRS